MMLPIKAGIYVDGDLVDSKGNKLQLADDATVQLWHPLDESADDILSWRIWLEENEIRQPVKQAHREIYLLTDAEEHTGTYSNRQAAHILAQTQYRSLAQTRAWSVDYLGGWDGGEMGIASKKIERFDIRSEFWVTPGGEDLDDGGFRYVATDQIRFYHPITADEPMQLADVPPIVFSEIMRDVDLFVGVASVGNNPSWYDGGPDGRYYEYWHSYSFGELSATATTRREVLERLLPKLKIADRCSIDGKYLVVQGDLRSYRIHLGSSNILMQPNDQYLCIVPKSSRAAVDRISLPFEGDTVLSVILSKAILLAADQKIKDPTILNQINASG